MLKRKASNSLLKAWVIFKGVKSYQNTIMMVDGKSLEKLQNDLIKADKEIAELRDRVEELDKKMKWTESLDQEKLKHLLDAISNPNVNK